MKATTVSTRYYARRSHTNRFPNAASRRFTAEKLLDTALAAATTLGGVVILMFLLALG